MGNVISRWMGLALGLLFLSASPASAYTLVDRSEVSYYYTMTGGVSGEFPSAEAAFKAYQDYLATKSTPTNQFVVRDLRWDGIYKINGLPSHFIWDWDDIYPNNPAKNRTGTTGAVSMSTRCPTSWNLAFKTNAGNYYYRDEWCEKLRQAPGEPASCKVDGASTPNPIVPASAEKLRNEVDWTDSGPSPLTFARIYRSGWGLDAAHAPGTLGQAWSHNHDWHLSFIKAGTTSRVSITTPEGYQRFFYGDLNGGAWTATNTADTLVHNGDASWTYGQGDDDSSFIFNAEGKLVSAATRNGRITSYTYNGEGRLATISNYFGRMVSLVYNSAGQLAGITTPDLRAVAYTYDGAGRLSSVIYPDAKTRAFAYENATFPYALTGIFDEVGARWGTFTYDNSGRAIGSELAAGAERYQVSYYNASLGVAYITDPLNTTRTYNYTTYNGKTTVTSGSHVPNDGSSGTQSREVSQKGLILSEYQFGGGTNKITWDEARRLPTSVSYVYNTADAKTVATQWHPTFSLPTLVTEAGRTTAYAYDALGNRVSKTITDTATNKVQQWQWTYNAQQQVATATEPNGAVTSFTYDFRGNVATTTNALGQVTSYAYDLANRVIGGTSPNGLSTSYTYDLRDRLLTQSVGGLTTTFTYKPYGSVETVSLPSGLMLTYAYDAAHRLIGWNNNRGESGVFTLDGMGNRTLEQVKDSAGNVAWSVARTINNINRLSGKTEGPDQVSTFGYGSSNGVLTSSTNGLNQTTKYGRDYLLRITTVTDAANASATLKYNALDAVTEAKDFKGVVTGYTRDAQGNATIEASPDAGVGTTQYDALGLPSQITDAPGQATTITRDALGRPTGLVFADGKTTTLRYDLTPNSVGYLSEVIDRSGTTVYTRDGFGRVILKKQTLANGSIQEVGYSYNPNGTLASMSYPNGGGLLNYAYDSTGRLTGLSLNGTPIVTGIAWDPLGQPTAWTWAFTSPSVAASRVYDTAGRLTSTEFSSYVSDPAGRITSLTQNLYQPGDADPTHNSIGNTNVTWGVVYNTVGRITGFNATGNTASFAYDANGNRTTSTRVLGTQTTTRTYSVGATSNQLTGFTQKINGASTTSVSYGYNAKGDMLSDGLRTYTHDAEGRLSTATTGATDVSPTTRYAHNALGQRVFKTEPLYPTNQGNASDPGFMQSLITFFTKLWDPSSSQAEQLGYAFVYDEQGSMIAEVGSGGSNSAGQAQYVYLPTANGPMPIAAVLNGTLYAVHSDHLNTPRKLTDSSGQTVWQWAYSAFGEDKPTTARNRFANLDVTSNPGTTGIADVKFNLRYPGQYFDEESGLFYNYFRSYDPRTGRYSQADPIGLNGGWNRYAYVGGNPLRNVDPSGLFVGSVHHWVTNQALGGEGHYPLAGLVSGVDFAPGAQSPENSFWHAMSDGIGGQSPDDAEKLYEKYLEDQLATCKQEGLARALHAAQDSAAEGHKGFHPWDGGRTHLHIPSLRHILADTFPSPAALEKAIQKSKRLIERFNSQCSCK